MPIAVRYEPNAVTFLKDAGHPSGADTPDLAGVMIDAKTSLFGGHNVSPRSKRSISSNGIR